METPSTEMRPWLVHWSKGQFLRQQFFQQWQQGILDHVAGHASLSKPFAHGLLQAPLFDPAELLKHRLSVVSLDALLPGGTRLAVPNDALVTPLDFKEAYTKSAEPLEFSVAIPRWKPGQANVAGAQSDPGRQRTRYRTLTRRCADDGSGTAEVDVEFRCLNARIELTRQVDRDHYDSLVVGRIVHGALNQPAIDPEFTPPALRLSALPSTENRVRGLLAELRAVGLQLSGRLSPELFSWGNVSSIQHEHLQRLRIVARYQSRLQSLLPDLNQSTGFAVAQPAWSPFDAFVLLRELLAELASLTPIWLDGEPFDHEHPGPSIGRLVQEIRTRLAPRQIRIPRQKSFEPLAKGHFKVALALDDFKANDRWYLGLKPGAGSSLEGHFLFLQDSKNFRLLPRALTHEISGKRQEGLKLKLRSADEIPDLNTEPGMKLFEIIRTNTDDALTNELKWRNLVESKDGIRELWLQWEDGKLAVNLDRIVLYMVDVDSRFTSSST